MVRVSGPAATAVAAAILRRRTGLEPRRATVTTAVVPGTGEAIDRVVATYFPGPGSYTGEDVVEISGHGSPLLLRRIVGAGLAAGARLAEPGEFTFRAYLHGRIDLVQAEAVADLVHAMTPLQARAAFDQLDGSMTTVIRELDHAVFDIVARLEASLDFPDEGYHFVEAGAVEDQVRTLAARVAKVLADAGRGRLVRDGCRIAIVGTPNVGKSTLFNALCGAPRAIVSGIPGTTRDLVTDTIDIGGIPATVVDTAGFRSAGDEVEAEGVRRAGRAIDTADAVVVVLDRSRPLGAEDRRLVAETRRARRLVVISKRDLDAVWSPDAAGLTEADRVVAVSLVERGGAGIEVARDAIADVVLDAAGVAAGTEPVRDVPAVTNLRHIELLRQVEAALTGAACAAGRGAAEELVLDDLQVARARLEEIAGPRASDAVLTQIFERFCIGK